MADGGGSSAGGEGARRKFKPKAPTRRPKSEETPANNLPPPEQQPDYRRAGGRDGRRDGYYGQRDGGRGRGGGRGRAPEPMGQDFFAAGGGGGGKASQADVARAAAAIDRKNAAKEAHKEYKAREKEIKEEGAEGGSSETHKNEAQDENENEERFDSRAPITWRDAHMDVESSDEDASVKGDTEEETESKDTTKKLNSGMKVAGASFKENTRMIPITLPFTQATGMGKEPLFADIKDEEALKREEDNAIYFVQFPTKLPEVLPQSKQPVPDEPPVKKEDGEEEQTNAEEVLYDQSLASMVAGKIGKILIHASGKMRLIIGGVPLEISQGLPCHFTAEVAAINTEEKTMCQFGQVNKRMVCSPDFETLFKLRDAHRGLKKEPKTEEELKDIPPPMDHAQPPPMDMHAQDPMDMQAQDPAPAGMHEGQGGGMGIHEENVHNDQENDVYMAEQRAEFADADDEL